MLYEHQRQFTFFIVLPGLDYDSRGLLVEHVIVLRKAEAYRKPVHYVEMLVTAGEVYRKLVVVGAHVICREGELRHKPLDDV